MSSLLTSIELRNAAWLLLALQPLLMLCVTWLLRRSRRDEFADRPLLPWVRGTRVAGLGMSRARFVALWLAWLLFGLAMAGPRIASGRIDSGDTPAFEVQVVVDLSRSMSARDVIPSRMARSRLELTDLITRMQDMRLGLIVYAARAHVMLPATADKSVLLHGVRLLDTQQLPTEGSDLLSALRFAAAQFSPASRSRAILLISDGEIHADADTDSAAMLAELKQADIRLFVLGMGTVQGAPLLADEQGWLQHAGQPVITRLQRTRLQALAEGGNGRFTEVREDDGDWQILYDNGLLRVLHSEVTGQAGEQIIWRELSAWFIAPGLLLLLLAYAGVPRAARTWPVPLVLLFCSGALVLSPAPVQAAEDYAAAFRLYERGEYAAAGRAFARLPGYAARFAEGVSHYQARNWAAAAASFIQATLDADTDAARAQALFNLGNVYFKQTAYLQAAQVYEDALRYAPELRGAHVNLEYARALQQAEREDAPLAAREGTGIRSARAPDQLEITRGQLSIDDSADAKPTQPELPDVTTPSLQDGTRLQQAAPATTRITRDADVSWSYDITSPEALGVQHTRFQVEEAELWQRLYEHEEGFVAPQDKPHALPGVAPW